MRQFWNSKKRRIVLFLGYIAFFIFLLEINLRITEYICNSIKVSNKRIFRIYCFGDSFTFGDGVSPKDSYPRQLEKLLNKSSEIKFKIFNLGIPGANSSQVLKYLQQILSKYAKPDLIILRIGVNDCWNFADNNFSFIPSKANITSKFKPLLNKFQLYRLIKNLIINFEENSEYDPFGREEDNPEYTRKSSDEFKKLVEFNITKMIEFAQLRQIPVVLQNYPGGDVYGPTTIANVAKYFSVPMVDNFYVFNEKLKEVKREDIFAPYWGYSHPNAKGYKIMAEEIYRVMIKQGFVNNSTS